MYYKNIPYGFELNQKLDIIIPKEQAVHCIVYIHGGAYLFGDKSEYPSFLIDYANSNIFATINYRLVDESNSIHMGDILSDIDSALKKVIELSNEHNVTIKDFILVGHSAGAQIALLYGYKIFKEKIKIAACVSLAGPTDFTDDIGWSSMTMWGENMQTRLSFLSQVGSRLTGHEIVLTQYNWTKQNNYSKFKEKIMEVSPISYVSGNRRIPPTLMVHARSDDQVPYSNARRLKKELDCASIPNKLITPSGSANSHMLGGVLYKENSPFVLENQIWVNEAREWIEAYLN
jgi:acetyl esterase/lipase